jgi:alanyl-tRNA synthetase
MQSNEIRNTFLNFFESKGHKIVPSAPMVVKNDPTLMFTNAGMNQFKDIFLGNVNARYNRVANSQKCLRVSGKHNDLEDVGHDTYHHTMFEMLGNWSFGDYFKKEAIAWSWELLTEVFKINPENLYVTVFGGDEKDGLPKDIDSYEIWKQHIDENRILFGSKKDNFWEMGDTGPCGPCSEIHIDLRTNEEKSKVSGKDLVNKDHHLVIEIWNNVFIEYNRLADSSLVQLPSKHVDTGMGFERLCMVLQGKQSNYDTDVFQPLIKEIAEISKINYGYSKKTDIAMRVIADHLRAVSFAIADGQLPSNNKAGYVIRRILRRAVRYGYTFLNFREPFIFSLVKILAEQMGHHYTELISQKELIQKVIAEEEFSFLKTLEHGINKFENYCKNDIKNSVISGNIAFELFDTFGFPVDLTQLMAKEKGLEVDMDGFIKCMNEQKERSRQAASIDADDWITFTDGEITTEFVGYDSLIADVKILKYRKLKNKDKIFYQLVLDKTPFYAESGGQVGDTGILENDNEKVEIFNTIKENDLIVHLSNKLPENLNAVFTACVDGEKRIATAINHSATHLLHYALRKILGEHVEQKGSLVDSNKLRFDFSHFSKLTDIEIRKVEQLINELIRKNYNLEEKRNISMKEAGELGAIALFGEKYGEKVRVIKFGESIELCGGTHVNFTGNIGMIKIVSESAIAAGIRRIEAITAKSAENYYYSQIDLIDNVKELFKGSKDIIKSINQLIEENNELKKLVTAFNKEKIEKISETLLQSAETINDINFISAELDIDAQLVKDLSFLMKSKIDNLFLVLGYKQTEKAYLSIAISDKLLKEKSLDAVKIIREIASEIQGNGGGQAFYATAGGKNPNGIKNAFLKAKTILTNQV